MVKINGKIYRSNGSYCWILELPIDEKAGIIEDNITIYSEYVPKLNDIITIWQKGHNCHELSSLGPTIIRYSPAKGFRKREFKIKKLKPRIREIDFVEFIDISVEEINKTKNMVPENKKQRRKKMIEDFEVKQFLKYAIVFVIGYLIGDKKLLQKAKEKFKKKVEDLTK